MLPQFLGGGSAQVRRRCDAGFSSPIGKPLPGLAISRSLHGEPDGVLIVGTLDYDSVDLLGTAEGDLQKHPRSHAPPTPPARDGEVVKGQFDFPGVGLGHQPPGVSAAQFLPASEDPHFSHAPGRSRVRARLQDAHLAQLPRRETEGELPPRLNWLENRHPQQLADAVPKRGLIGHQHFAARIGLWRCVEGEDPFPLRYGGFDHACDRVAPEVFLKIVLLGFEPQCGTPWNRFRQPPSMRRGVERDDRGPRQHGMNNDNHRHHGRPPRQPQSHRESNERKRRDQKARIAIAEQRQGEDDRRQQKPPGHRIPQAKQGNRGQQQQRSEHAFGVALDRELPRRVPGRLHTLPPLQSFDVEAFERRVHIRIGKEAVEKRGDRVADRDPVFRHPRDDQHRGENRHHRYSADPFRPAAVQFPRHKAQRVEKPDRRGVLDGIAEAGEQADGRQQAATRVVLPDFPLPDAQQIDDVKQNRRRGDVVVRARSVYPNQRAQKDQQRRKHACLGEPETASETQHRQRQRA